MSSTESAFWVAVATSAPLIALTAVAAITAVVSFVAATRPAGPNLKASRFVISGILFALNIGAQTLLLAFALTSLATARSQLPLAIPIGVETGGVAAVIIATMLPIMAIINAQT